MSPPVLAKKVWITRTQPGAAQSAAALTKAGYDVIIAPLLTVAAVSTPNACPVNDSVLAFTSSNGVRAFKALSDRRNWPVYAIGDATARAAKAAGFETVHNAGGDVRDLSAMIIEARPDYVTHLSGVHAAGDLIGDLASRDIPGVRTIIYGTQAAADLPSSVLNYLEAGQSLAVTLWSPKATHIFMSLTPQLYWPLLHCISLSDNIDAVLNAAGGRFASRQIAVHPDAPSMTALLEAVAVKA